MKTIQLLYIVLISLGICAGSQAQVMDANDRLALIDLLNSTNGNSPGGWNTLLPAADQWISNPEVQWHGVTMDADGYVIEVDLDGVGMTGTLPTNLFSGTRLNKLTRLVLSNNQITGNLGGTDWLSLASSTALSFLDISYNEFTYQAGFLKDLFNGSVIDSLMARNYLSAASAGNNCPGIPVGLAHMDLGENGFVGNIPNLKAVDHALVSVWLDNNNFTGMTNYGQPNESGITYMNISNNDLADPAAIQFFLNTQVSLIEFRGRSALDESVTYDYSDVMPAGMLGTENGDLILDLSYNNIVGAMIGANLKELDQFYMDHNQISSIIDPTGLTTDYDIYILDLSYNQIQTFPKMLFDKIITLEEVYLNNNLLNTDLPVPQNGTDYRFDVAKILDFSFNQLSGDLNLEWILNRQADLGSPIQELRFGNNEFTTASFTSSTEDFANLTFVDVDSNNLHFDDLYIIATGLNMQRVYPNGPAAIGHYVPNGNPDTLAYDYHPQNGIWEGGTRRRDIGAATVFKAEIRAPLWVNNYNYYNWYREDATNTITEHFGQVNTDGINTTVSGTPTATVTPGSYRLSPSDQFDTRQHLYVDPIDMTYTDWSYKGCASNDTFSLTSICTNFKKFVVGPCYDSLGRKIRCQEMIIQFAAGTTDEDKDSLRVELDIERIDSCICGSVELWAISDTTNQLEVEQNGTGTRKAVTNVGTRPSLLGVDPNYDLADDIAPVVGDSTPSAPSGNTNSSATLVAIIDSGVDYDHPDVADRIAINTDDLTFDGIDDDANCVVDDAYGYNALDVKAVPFDDHGHGTSIAGILAGRSTPNVSPNSGPTDNLAIVPMKYTGQKGRGSSYNAACAIRHAADYVDPFTGGEIRVINASWGYYGEPSAVLEEAIRYAGEDCGLLFVCSAGNDGFDNDTVSHYPSNYTLENVLVVAAVQNGNPDQLEAYSSYGAESVDIAAEGNFTTARAGTGAGTHSMDGTSFATAQVTRAAGLLFQAHPESSYRAVRHAILSSADPLSGPDAAKLSSGGRLDFAAAQSALAGNADRVECMPIVHLDVRLEGPLKSNGVMEADLFTTGNLPNSQPYNVAPWFYNGTESISATFTGGNRPVDWVLLRFDTERGNHSMYVAGLLQRDGDIVDGAGEGIRFPETYSDRDYYVTVIHRNHLALTSRVPIRFDYPATSFDLSDLSAGAPATSRYKDLYSYRVLVAGDGNSDSQVNPIDKNIHWIPQDGQSGYKSADYNMDGVVDNADRALWELNKSIETDAARGYEDSNN